MPSSTQWRLYIRSVAGSTSNNTTIAEMEMASSVGGADLCSGGSASAEYSNASAGYLVDNDNAQAWGSVTTARPTWVGYTFATAVTIEQVKLTPSVLVNEFPKNFDVQYFDGADWQTYWSAQPDEIPASPAAETTYTYTNHSNTGLARKWRVYIESPTQASAFINLTEIEFRDVFRGPNLASGGTGAVSSSAFASADAMFDGNNENFWSSDGTPPQWVSYEASIPITVNELMIEAYVNAGNTPKALKLQYDNAGSWQNYLAIPDAGLWNTYGRKWFTYPGDVWTGDHLVNFANSYSYSDGLATMGTHFVPTEDFTVRGLMVSSRITAGSNYQPFIYQLDNSKNFVAEIAVGPVITVGTSITSYVPREWWFDDPVTLVAGTRYAMGLRRPGGSNADLHFYTDSNGPLTAPLTIGGVYGNSSSLTPSAGAAPSLVNDGTVVWVVGPIWKSYAYVPPEPTIESGAGSAAGTATAAAVGAALNIAAGAGSAAGTGAVSAVSTDENILAGAGAAAGVGAGAATSALVRSSQGLASGLGLATAASAATGTIATRGQALGSGVAAGASDPIRAIAGTATGTSTAIGAAFALGTISAVGDAAGVSATTAGTFATGIISGVAEAAATSTAAGVGSGRLQAAGAAAATSAASGVGAYKETDAVGRSAGRSTAAATAQGIRASVGEAAARALVFGFPTKVLGIIGNADAHGSGLAITVRFEEMVGAAFGTSTVGATGAGVRNSVGVSAATSSASGVSASPGSARGAASSTSTAAGVTAMLAGRAGVSTASSRAIGVAAGTWAVAGTAAGTSSAQGRTTALLPAVGGAASSAAAGATGRGSGNGAGRSSGLSLATANGVRVGWFAPGPRIIVVPPHPRRVVAAPEPRSARVVVVAPRQKIVIVEQAGRSVSTA